MSIRVEDLFPKSKLIHQEVMVIKEFVQETALFQNGNDFFLAQISNAEGEEEEVREVYLSSQQAKVFGEKLLLATKK